MTPVDKCTRRICAVLSILTLLGSSLTPSPVPLHARQRPPDQRRSSAALDSSAIDCCDVFPYSDSSNKDKKALIYVAAVRLTAVWPLVPTSQLSSCGTTYPNPGFTPEIASTVHPGLVLSINANFFWWDHGQNVHDLTCLRSIGLAVSEYKIISFPGEGINEAKTGKKVLPDTLLFYDSGVQIVKEPGLGYTPPASVRTAVSGILIVDEGKDISNSQRVKDADINANGNEPRTAIGLSGDGYTLYVIAAVGGVPGYAGITLPDLAQLFIKSYGAYMVLNLDGGGSTALNYYGDLNLQKMTAPKDNYPIAAGPTLDLRQYRPVPVSLSFISGEATSVVNRQVVGTPAPQDALFWGETINAVGSFNVLNNATLAFEAEDRIVLGPDSAVITNRPGVPNSAGSFRAKIRR